MRVQKWYPWPLWPKKYFNFDLPRPAAPAAGHQSSQGDVSTSAQLILTWREPRQGVGDTCPWTMDSKVDSLISLKGNSKINLKYLTTNLNYSVHRIVPRNDEAIAHFLTANELVAFFTLEDELQADEKALPPEYSENWRYLPKLYGQVYLGETFSFHIKASNESTNEVTQVTVRSDLQLYSNRVVTLGEGKKDRLLPKEFVHQVYQHEIKELGNHVLIVTLSYKTAESVDALVFRRYFKFRVEKPLDVKTKFYNAEVREGEKRERKRKKKNEKSFDLCSTRADVICMLELLLSSPDRVTKCTLKPCCKISPTCPCVSTR